MQQFVLLQLSASNPGVYWKAFMYVIWYHLS